MNRVKDKIALITGAARGQGRQHAIRLAEEGASVIMVDLCDDIQSVGYSMAGSTDLEETVRMVEKAGGRVVAKKADVRDYAAVRGAVGEAVAELGQIDVVIPNAGILPMGMDLPVSSFADAVDVDLCGAINTVHAALPHLNKGASIIMVGSVAGFMPAGPEDEVAGPGYVGYKLAKRALGDYMRELALLLAPSGTRVNSVHPTSVDTDMSFNESMYRTYRPDLEHPTRADVEPILATLQPMPISYVTTDDVTNAVVFLASEESRYITGTQLKIDGGALLKLRL
jgi:SDR family mycofactocin-dependent oxidoreductase